MGSFIYLTQTVQHGDGNAFMYLAWNVNFLVVMATSAHVLQRLATRCLGNNCWCVMSMRFSWHMLMCINSVSHSQCLSLRLWKREWGAGADPGFWSGGPSGVLTPRRALSPKCAQNRFFPLKLPENCMIKKNLGAKGGGAGWCLHCTDHLTALGKLTWPRLPLPHPPLSLVILFPKRQKCVLLVTDKRMMLHVQSLQCLTQPPHSLSTPNWVALFCFRKIYGWVPLNKHNPVKILRFERILN